MSQTKANFNRLHHAIHDQWVNQSQNDPEFGGANFERNLNVAKQVIRRFGGQSFQGVLNKTGMGSHPDMIRIFWKIGQALAQPKSNNDNAQQKSSGKSIGELFYPGFNGGK